MTRRKQNTPASSKPASAPRTRTPARTSQPRVQTFLCPRCGRDMAKIIGRSEVIPVLYLRCDGCLLPSVVAA